MTPFCGWIQQNTPLNANEADNILQHMLGTDPHERQLGPHHALAISQTDHSFFIQDSNTTVLVNGHPRWNDEQLATQAAKNSHAHALQHAYQRDGIACLHRLQGQFYFLIIDHSQQVSYLGTDRIGSQPVYYQWQPELSLLAFGSSAAMVKRHPQTHCQLSEQAIFNYLYFHMIPSPGTVYKDTYKLEPAQYVKVQHDKLSHHTYWLPDFSDYTSFNDDELGNLVYDTLRSAVLRASEQPNPGAFLSGGLDSSTVAGFFSQVSTEPAKTFSIGFPVAAYNEIDYARIASRHFKTEQHEYFIQPEDILTAYDSIIGALDEPFGNSSVLPTYFCAKLAKENGVSTMLAGDGGDEIFAGNTRYQKQIIFENYQKVPSLARQKLLEPIIMQSVFSRLPLGSKAQSYIKQALTPLPDRLENYNFLHQHAASEVFTADFLQKVDIEAPLSHLRDVYHRPKQGDYINRMLYLDWKRTLADNDLPKVNRMCQLAGVDVVYPMLDDDLIALTCSIPSNKKVNFQKLRYIYKHAVRNFLPEAIINKPKHGFGLPFGIWTKEHKPLQEYAYQSLDHVESLGVFHPEFLANAKHMHQHQHSDYYGELIWLLMTLGQWCKTHLDE